MNSILLRYAVAGFLCSLASQSQAGITAVNSPFAGTYTETFESFPIGWSPTGSLTIMGGEAVLAGSGGFPSSVLGADLDGIESLGSSGMARVSDGNQLALLEGWGWLVTLTFDKPVRKFGGYWGTYTGAGYQEPGPFELKFLDEFGGEIGTRGFDYSHTATGDGLLDWHGWSSDIDIKSIEIRSGMQVVTDGLQASIPEPGVYVLLAGVGLLGFAACRRARRQGC